MVESENTLILLSMYFCYLSPSKEFFKGHQSLLTSRYTHSKSCWHSFLNLFTGRYFCPLLSIGKIRNLISLSVCISEQKYCATSWIYSFCSLWLWKKIYWFTFHYKPFVIKLCHHRGFLRQVSLVLTLTKHHWKIYLGSNTPVTRN